MCIATTFGKMGCIDALLQLGADVNVRDNDGNAAVNFAINSGYMDIAAKLAPLCQEDILIQLFEHLSHKILVFQWKIGNIPLSF